MGEALEIFLVMMTITMVPMITYFSWRYLNLVMKKKEQEFSGVSSNGDIEKLQKQVGNIMAENEELKEELETIKDLLKESNSHIDLSELDNEQILIDKQNKFKY